jgi:MoaA/NifB/PqqE/SkfB family radical SAM enzyme
MNFSNMTLFTTALCNLNCGYCYICKDAAGGLAQIDKDLEQDFANDQYIKQVLDYDPELRNTIDGITLWGGEPFLHMERFTDHIKAYFDAFPNFNKIMTSTNFTIPNQAKIIEHLLKEIGKYYNGNVYFNFDLQISIDGYPEMNDFGRGKGTTEKFLKNFRDLCDIDYDTSKIILSVHTKPTLSKETMHFLDTPEKCIKWYTFFDTELYQVQKENNAKWNYHNSVFNCASPSEWTKEDGYTYAKINQNILDSQKYIQETCESWRSDVTLIPLAITGLTSLSSRSSCKRCGTVQVDRSLEEAGKSYRNPKCGGGCGSFTGNIVPIPKGMFTMCHRGLFDEYVEYANNVQKQGSINGLSDKYFGAHNTKDWLYTPEEMRQAHNMMVPFETSPNQILYTDLILFVREYAKAGLIDPKYTSIAEIEKTLPAFMENSICLQDNYIMNGSWTTRNCLEIPLFYNGAMDIVVSELDRVAREYKVKEVL